MKNKIFKSGFCEKLKLLLIPIGLLIGSLNMQLWADTQFDMVSIKYSLDGGSTENTYNCTYSAGNFTNGAVVTSSLVITEVYMKFREYDGHVCGGQFYYYDGSGHWWGDGYWNWNWNCYGDDYYGGKRSGSQLENSSFDLTLANSTDPSGNKTIYYCWNLYGNNKNRYDGDCACYNWYMPGWGNDNQALTFTILPPVVTDFNVSASGQISGNGTEDDPYIIPHDGTLTLSLSELLEGASKEHSDPNSVVQFSVDGGENWGTESSYKTYTIENITATSTQNYVFKARCYNEDDDLESPEITTKTIYYKTSPWSIAGTMNGWSTTDNPIAHYSSGTGYAELTLDANTTYAFKVMDRTTSAWYGQQNSGGTMVYPTDNNNIWQFDSPGYDCNIKTAGKGTYRFTWSGSAHTLTVTYPTSYIVTFGYGDHGSTVTASGSGSGDIESGEYVAKGENVTFEETHDTGYKLKGWYTAESGGSVVGTMSSSDNVLNSIAANANVYAQYEGNDFTVRFNANYPSGAVNNGASMDNQAFVYATAQNISANAFACEGYTFTGWKKDNATSGDDVTAGSDGSTLTTTDGATVDLYAQWSDDGTYYYKGASASGWATAANWTRNAVPGSTDDVIVLTALNAPSGTTTVNSIRIATSGTYTPVGGSGITANGSLTIPSGAALKVVTNVANCTISANAPTSGTSTTSSTLNIGYGGALVWGTAGTPGDATVGFSTVSGGVPGSQDAINDYIGIPFTSLSSDAYSNAWVFAVSGGAWTEISGATLSPWTGYNIIEKKEEGEPAGGSYSLSGTLVANNATVSGGASAGTEILYANSWVAPIKISEMDFSGTATVYLFNPASYNQIVSEANPLGNYTSYPKNSSGGAYIPSMKSFSVVSSTVSINYASAVYGQVGGAYSAPRRERKADYRQAIWDTQDTLFVYVKCASGWADELKMYIHNDFSQDYENGWDGPKMEGMWEAPKLYMLNNEGEMAVSCVPSVDNTIIAFHAGTAANEYTMTLKYSGDDELYLRDTKTGDEIRLTAETSYEFTSEPNDSDMRFVIRKAQQVLTGNEELKASTNVQKVMHNGTLYIVREGKVYSAEGTLVK